MTIVRASRVTRAALAVSLAVHAGALGALQYGVRPTPAARPVQTRGEAVPAVRITFIPPEALVPPPTLERMPAAEPARRVPAEALEVDRVEAWGPPKATAERPSHTPAVFAGPPPLEYPPALPSEARGSVPEVVLGPVPSVTVAHAGPPEWTPPPQEAVRPGVPTVAAVLEVPAPQYPLRSRRRGEEGVVVIEVQVLVTGRAGRVRVIEDPGYPRLVEAALDAARQGRYEPATRGGAAVASALEVPFRFALR